MGKLRRSGLSVGRLRGKFTPDLGVLVFFINVNNRDCYPIGGVVDDLFAEEDGIYLSQCSSEVAMLSE